MTTNWIKTKSDLSNILLKGKIELTKEINQDIKETKETKEDDTNILSIKTMNFVKTKNTISYKKTNNSDIYKKNYSIINKLGNRPTISIENIVIPFGYELYNKKYILNLKLNITNNHHYNILSTILAFENEIANINNYTDKDIIQDIEGKEYFHNLKQDEHFIRTYVIGTPNIYANINGIKTSLTHNDIKKTIANVEIELGTFWITDNNYGILWFIKNIQIIKKN